ncbi:MAG TPA: hypothetical protein VF314_05770 [Actinomycetes bacterium]
MTAAVTRHPATARAVAGCAAAGACLLVLTPGQPAVAAVTVGAATVAAAAVAVGWRWLGSAATLLVTAALLLAGATAPDLVGPGRLTAASALLLVFVSGLDTAPGPRRTVRRDTLTTAPLPRRVGLPAVGVAAAACVGLVARQPATASAWLVLVGLVAAVAALLVSTRGH